MSDDAPRAESRPPAEAAAGAREPAALACEAGDRKVGTLADYVAAVEAVRARWRPRNLTTHLWYRGQGGYDWSLVPSLYRGRVDPKHEREIVRDFRLRASTYLEPGRMPTEYLEWLFVMQHHGLPTRLLDWSESHLVGLYFAVLDHANTGDAAVWVLDPWDLNYASQRIKTVPTMTHSRLRGYVPAEDGEEVVREIEAEKPLALRAVRGTRRIIAQSGTFTIHGSGRGGIETLAGTRPKVELCRIRIDGGCKLKLLQELYFAGVSHAVLFPDLDGLSRDVAFRYSMDFLGHDAPGRKSRSRKPPRAGDAPPAE